MLQSMGSQKVRHDLVTEQHKCSSQHLGHVPCLECFGYLHDSVILMRFIFTFLLNGTHYLHSAFSKVFFS